MKFLKGIAACVTIITVLCTGVYAAELDISVDENRIVTVKGESDAESVYMKAYIGELADNDRRGGFRYIGRQKTDSNKYEFSFYALDGGVYEITVNDTNNNIITDRITLEKPAVNIAGGGAVGKRINLVYSLPKCASGSNGVIKTEFATAGVKLLDIPVTSEDLDFDITKNEASQLELSYTITGDTPKLFIAMTTDQSFAGEEITVKTNEFTLATNYSDEVSCKYDAQTVLTLTSLETVNEKITAAENAINALIPVEKINVKNYEEAEAALKAANDAIAAAVEVGAVREEDFSYALLEKITETEQKLAELKPVADVLLGIIDKETVESKYDYIKENKSILGIKDETLTLIDESEKKDDIIKALAKKECYTVDELLYELGSAVILNELTVTDYTGVQALLDNLEYAVKIYFPEMSEGVRRAVAKRDFDSVEILKQAIDKAIDAENNDDDSHGGGSSGSGSVSNQISSGGISGSHGGSNYSPITIPVSGGNQNTEDTKSETVFTDLDEATWAAEYVNTLYEKNIIEGDGNGEFRPNDSITRAEFVKLLVMAMGIEGTAENMNFNDVQPDDWYYDYVSAAVTNNIVNGISETQFGAAGLLSRQDMVVLICRATGTATEGEVPEFADSDQIADYAVGAVAAMSKIGVVNGFEDNTFRPAETATRAMAAKVICSIMEGGIGK